MRQLLEIIELTEPLVRGGGMRWQLRGDLRGVRGGRANLEAREVIRALAPLGVDETTEAEVRVTVGSREGAELLAQRLSS